MNALGRIIDAGYRLSEAVRALRVAHRRMDDSLVDVFRSNEDVQTCRTELQRADDEACRAQTEMDLALEAAAEIALRDDVSWWQRP